MIKELFLASKASKLLPSSLRTREMLASLKQLLNMLSGRPGVMGQLSLAHQPPLNVLQPEAMLTTLCIACFARYSSDI